jgi:shikimate kinase
VTYKRVSKQVGQRPLLDVTNPRQAIREMLKFRKPFYEQAADITVNTSKIIPEEVAEEIIEKIKEDESLNR